MSAVMLGVAVCAAIVVALVVVMALHGLAVIGYQLSRIANALDVLKPGEPQ